MVWAALLYSIVGTWVTERVGRRLVRLDFEQQRYEADFRFSLVRLRENTEGVALYRGEPDELENFRQRFRRVVENWWGIMGLQKRLTDEGTTFSAVAEQTRIDKARQSLASKSRSISDIALDLGYSEHSCFTRAFKRWTGQTPEEYRQRSAAYSRSN